MPIPCEANGIIVRAMEGYVPEIWATYEARSDRVPTDYAPLLALLRGSVPTPTA